MSSIFKIDISVFVYIFLCGRALLVNRQVITIVNQKILFIFLFPLSIMDIVIDNASSDQRFDRFLRKRFKKYPQVRLADIYSMIRK